MKKGFVAVALAGMMVSGCAYQKQSDIQSAQPPAPAQPQSPQYAPGDEINMVPGVVPNAPILNEAEMIEISAVGMGVAPESTISPAQALALAKRAAIVDGYRQLGEKMYGIKVNAKETVKDMIMRNSVVRTRVFAVIKNAEVLETAFKDGLCQVQMELKLDAQRWRYILTGRK